MLQHNMVKQEAQGNFTQFLSSIGLQNILSPNITRCAVCPLLPLTMRTFLLGSHQTSDNNWQTEPILAACSASGQQFSASGCISQAAYRNNRTPLVFCPHQQTGTLSLWASLWCGLSLSACLCFRLHCGSGRKASLTNSPAFSHLMSVVLLF